jgi:hypothetical protein
MKRVLAMALAAIALNGCVRRTGDFTVVSTRNVLGDIERSNQRVSGSSCTYWLLFGWIHLTEKNLEAAFDDALRKVPDYDTLVDVVTTEPDVGLIVAGTHCITIEGTPARLASARPPAGISGSSAGRP